MNTLVGAIHDAVLAGRRARILAHGIAELLADARTVLDVGCGDGSIDLLIQEANPALFILGVDVLVQPNTKTSVASFDGRTLPFGDQTFDAVIFIDVLHHTVDPCVLLKEAKRVARSAVVLKDHTMEGPLAYRTLRLMDWVGNAHRGTALPYNYWREQRWRDTFASLGLRIECWQNRLNLYPWPASLVFDRRLHFVARLKP